MSTYNYSNVLFVSKWHNFGFCPLSGCSVGGDFKTKKITQSLIFLCLESLGEQLPGAVESSSSEDEVEDGEDSSSEEESDSDDNPENNEDEESEVRMKLREAKIFYKMSVRISEINSKNF